MDSAPIRRPQLDELETFLLAARHGSLTRAAEELRLSKTAVAKRLRSLEALVGHRLLERGPRGATLTDAGRQLAPHVEELLRESDRVFGRLRELRGGDDPERISGFRTLSGAAPTSTERVLQETERLFAEIFHSVDESISLVDAETGVLLEVNDAFTRMVGRTRDETIGRTAAEVNIAPARHVDAIHREVLASGAAYKGVLDVKHADGRTLTVEFTQRPITVAGKQYLLGVSHDITDRIQLDRTIRKQAAQQQAIAELTLAALAGEPLANVLSSAAELIGSHLEASFAAVCDVSGDRVELRSVFGAPFDRLAESIDVSETRHAFLQSLAAGEVLAEDVTRDRRFSRTGVRTLGLRSLVAVPVRAYGADTSGFVAAGWPSVGAYTDADVHFLRSAVNVIGVIVRSERRLELERRRQILVDNFTALVDASPEPTALLSLEGHYVYLNAASRGMREVGAEIDPSSVSIYDDLDARGVRRLRDVVFPETQRTGRWEGSFTVTRVSSGRRTPGRLKTILVRDPADGAARWIAAIFQPQPPG